MNKIAKPAITILILLYLFSNSISCTLSNQERDVFNVKTFVLEGTGNKSATKVNIYINNDSICNCIYYESIMDIPEFKMIKKKFDEEILVDSALKNVELYSEKAFLWSISQALKDTGYIFDNLPINRCLKKVFKKYSFSIDDPIDMWNLAAIIKAADFPGHPIASSMDMDSLWLDIQDKYLSDIEMGCLIHNMDMRTGKLDKLLYFIELELVHNLINQKTLDTTTQIYFLDFFNQEKGNCSSMKIGRAHV